MVCADFSGLFKNSIGDSLNFSKPVQMVSCLTAQAEMADEFSPGVSDRQVAEKRSKSKCEERDCFAPSLPRAQILINTHSVTTGLSFGSICVGMNLLSESSDTGILYLNPQEPEWSLVEEFAELSSTENPGHKDDEDCRMKSNAAHVSNRVMMEAAQKKDMKSSNLQCDSSGRQRASELQELNDEEHSSEEGENGPQKKGVKSCPVKTSLKNQKGDKVSRLMGTMKKRSGVDTEQRPFKCPHCHWAFKKYCNLQSHLQTHTGLKPHVCDICDKAYSHQGTLQQHKRLHTGERPYHCPFCVKTYIWSSDYRKHIRTHTGEKPYVCDACGKDFIRSSDLRKHERNMHTNNRPFPCLHCDKTFNKPLSLKRHERKHLGERPFSCPDCGKAFALASRMAEHQKIHAGVRPYICLVCRKSFTKSSNLTEHEAIHSGVRPHKCKECGVAFAMASRLVRHQFIHSKEKRHSCTGCSKSFCQLATLKTHQEQTCSGRIFVCMACDKSFPCATKLAQHTLTHREEKV